MIQLMLRRLTGAKYGNGFSKATAETGHGIGFWNKLLGGLFLLMGLFGPQVLRRHAFVVRRSGSGSTPGRTSDAERLIVGRLVQRETPGFTAGNRGFGPGLSTWLSMLRKVSRVRQAGPPC